MNNKADQEVTAFLKETHAIPGFRKVSFFFWIGGTFVFINIYLLSVCIYLFIVNHHKAVLTN